MDVKKLLGEAADCEIFERLDEKDPGLLRTASTFANGEGGVLILGTEDPRGTSQTIHTLLRERMDPVPPFSIHTRTVDDKPVLLLKVEPGMETPCYCLEWTGRTACPSVMNSPKWLLQS